MVLQDIYFLCVIALIRGADGLFPVALTCAITHLLTRVALTCSRRKVRRVRENLAVTFGGRQNSEQTEKILYRTFYEFWREMFGWSVGGDITAQVRQVEIEGMEHLQDALLRGSGVILWESNGLGSRLLAHKTLHAHGVAVHRVHGPNNLGGFMTADSRATYVRRTWVKPFFERRERQFTAEGIELPHTDSLVFARTLLRHLVENRIVCAAGDGQVAAGKISICFLGHMKSFATGLVSAAKLSGAPLLPMFCLRQENGTPILRIEEPLYVPQNADRVLATRMILEQYAALLERRIKQFPEQYRNWHLLETFSHTPVQRGQAHGTRHSF